MKSAQEGGQSQEIWEIREGGLGSTAFARDEDNWPGWEDSALPPDAIGRYVADLRELLNRHGSAFLQLTTGASLDWARAAVAASP